MRKPGKSRSALAATRSSSNAKVTPDSSCGTGTSRSRALGSGTTATSGPSPAAAAADAERACSSAGSSRKPTCSRRLGSGTLSSGVMRTGVRAG